MRWVFAVLSLVLAVLLAGCGGSGNEKGAVASTSAPASGQPATMPPGEPAKPPPTDLLPSTESTESAADTAKRLANEVKKVKVTFVMPNLVGKNLQAAQDDLQALGSYLLDQQDATGAHRITVIDSDWKVCSQKPKRGATVPIVAMVQLAAVKLKESCP
jgi:ABC-type Fe3+-hydroxamate transport system substrate-binding protein